MGTRGSKEAMRLFQDPLGGRAIWWAAHKCSSYPSSVVGSYLPGQLLGGDLGSDLANQTRVSWGLGRPLRVHCLPVSVGLEGQTLVVRAC